MATKNPRVCITLARPLYEQIRRRAEEEGVSLSAKVRDLLESAMELEDDAYWVALGEERLRSFDQSKARTHDEVWPRLTRKGKWTGKAPQVMH